MIKKIFLKIISIIFLLIITQSQLFAVNNSLNEKQLIDKIHLKYNKHEVVLFHTYDEETEFNFNFDISPKKFVDVETSEEINVYAENIQDSYKELVRKYFKDLKNKFLSTFNFKNFF